MKKRHQAGKKIAAWLMALSLCMTAVPAEQVVYAAGGQNETEVTELTENRKQQRTPKRWMILKQQRAKTQRITGKRTLLRRWKLTVPKTSPRQPKIRKV